jgi:hypothetical protein
MNVFRKWYKPSSGRDAKELLVRMRFPPERVRKMSAKQAKAVYNAVQMKANQ